MSWDRDHTRFRRMLVMLVAPGSPHVAPAIGFQRAGPDPEPSRLILADRAEPYLSFPPRRRPVIHHPLRRILLAPSVHLHTAHPRPSVAPHRPGLRNVRLGR